VKESDYRPRHRKHADPASLPYALRGLADLVEVIDDSDES
jgi:hypothetical protein